MEDEYVDPLVNGIGAVAITLGTLALGAVGAYAIAVMQIDHQREYCPWTGTEILVKECREAR